MRVLGRMRYDTNRSGMIFKVSRRDNLDRYYIMQMFGFGLFVHHVHHDEDKDTFHTHPWDGFSIILGSYLEEVIGSSPRLRRWWNVVIATRPHRVELPHGPVWSVFVHGRRYNRWQVIDRSGEVLDVEPWHGTEGRTSYRRPKP